MGEVMLRFLWKKTMVKSASEQSITHNGTDMCTITSGWCRHVMCCCIFFWQCCHWEVGESPPASWRVAGTNTQNQGIPSRGMAILANQTWADMLERGQSLQFSIFLAQILRHSVTLLQVHLLLACSLSQLVGSVNIGPEPFSGCICPFQPLSRLMPAEISTYLYFQNQWNRELHCQNFGILSPPHYRNQKF